MYHPISFVYILFSFAQETTLARVTLPAGEGGTQMVRCGGADFKMLHAVFAQ
jgi:hypothetical protein